MNRLNGLEENRIEERMLEELACFPLYDANQSVRVISAGNKTVIKYHNRSGYRESQTRAEFSISGNEGRIEEFEIEGQFRGKGNGTALYICIETLMREAGCCRIRLNPSDESSENFWKKQGFRFAHCAYEKEL